MSAARATSTDFPPHGVEKRAVRKAFAAREPRRGSASLRRVRATEASLPSRVHRVTTTMFRGLALIAGVVAALLAAGLATARTDGAHQTAAPAAPSGDPVFV